MDVCVPRGNLGVYLTPSGLCDVITSGVFFADFLDLCNEFRRREDFSLSSLKVFNKSIVHKRIQYYYYLCRYRY